MQMINFTWDEGAILAIYKSDSPTESIAKMEESLPYIDDVDMATLVEQVIEKMKHMTNIEYQTLKCNEYDFLFEEDVEND